MMNLRYRADKSVPKSVLAQANALDLSANSEADLASLSHSQSETQPTRRPPTSKRRLPPSLGHPTLPLRVTLL